MPEKVTVRWVVDHVPVNWWWALGVGVVTIVAAIITATIWVDHLRIVK